MKMRKHRKEKPFRGLLARANNCNNCRLVEDRSVVEQGLREKGKEKQAAGAFRRDIPQCWKHLGGRRREATDRVSNAKVPMYELRAHMEQVVA